MTSMTDLNSALHYAQKKKKKMQVKCQNPIFPVKPNSTLTKLDPQFSTHKTHSPRPNSTR
jgi:hypothetical protein